MPFAFKTNMNIQYLLKAAITLFICVAHFNTSGSTVKKLSPGTSAFDTITTVKPEEREHAAYSVYREKFRHNTPAAAMEALDQLFKIAGNAKDKSLQSCVFDMRADYYSINRGYNPVSTVYYKQAIAFSEENDLPVQTGRSMNNLGNYFFIYKQYVPACEYFLQSIETFRKIGYANVPGINNYLKHIIDFYYAIGDYDNARLNLEDALKYVPADSRDRLNIINTIGLIDRTYKKYPQSLKRFYQVLSLSTTEKDLEWVGIATGNIGSVYFLQKDYAKALPFVEADYNSSIKFDDKINACIALLRLIKINIESKDYIKATARLKKANEILSHTNINVLQYWATYYDLKAQLAENTGDIKNAIIYRKIYETNTDSLNKLDNLAGVERIKLRHEIDRRTAQLSKLENDGKLKTVQIRAAAAVSVLLIVISLLLYNRQRLKNIKDRDLLLAEKKIAEEREQHANLELKAFTENLRQKNLLIESFKTEIDQLNQQSTGEANAEHLEQLMQAHIMTDDNWNDFKKLFSKVYPGFFINLSKNHPALSATDTRLLALIKLDLSNSEMSNMLGITIEGVKKAKQRLRKKISYTDINNIA